MVTFCLGLLITLNDPVSVVQLQYPANRVTITTGSSRMIYYTLPQDAPIELRRAYKLVEVAEREVLITEALQLYRAEMVANERRLEALKTAKMASFLDGSASPIREFANSSTRSYPGALLQVDPTLSALTTESNFRYELGHML
ncbi:MAG TPA: hypothetical protein VKE94_21905, partial [Gemmataceae bacterium]|nr:hypothetical protein [Gemmataceae bacterium]